ncbi:MAG: hypothetical protein ACR2IR_03415 [Acidimicrobiia bacterium]
MPDTGGRALLERELRTLARDLDAELGELDLSSAVVRRLRTAAAPARRRVPSPRRRLAVVLVAAIAATSVAALPAARAAVNRIFEIGAVEVRDEPPPRVPSGSATLELGEPTTLAEARDHGPVVVPTAAGLGKPDEVWFDGRAGGAVSLVFRAGPDLPAAEHTGIGLLVQEFAGDGQEVARKYLATDVRARPVVIGADEGVFLDGGDHYLFYTDPTGADVYEDGRLVGNALILTRGTLTIRLEGDLPLDRMVAIAESLR